MNRYGWCPDEYVAPDEPRYDWLRHFPSGYSITHLEMYAISLTYTHVRGVLSEISRFSYSPSGTTLY
jgi:hypothetical protein